MTTSFTIFIKSSDIKIRKDLPKPTQNHKKKKGKGSYNRKTFKNFNY